VIVKAAIKKGDQVYTGSRHHLIIHEHRGMFKTKDSVQGFITDTGEFLNRQQASEHAFNCGQIKENVGNLLSEDLW
jgi:hypothetical protein